MTTDIILPAAALDASQLAALGAVVVQSGILEHKLNLMIQSLTGLDDPQLRMISRGAMLDVKLGIIASLGEQKFKGKRSKAQLKWLVTYLKQRNAERTIVVHGIWRWPNGPLGALLDANKGRTVDPEAILYRTNATFKASRLPALAARIEIAANDLWELFMDKRAKPAMKRAERERRKRKEFKAGMDKLLATIQGLSRTVRPAAEAARAASGAQLHKAK
jgi:hypothetical protein